MSFYASIPGRRVLTAEEQQRILDGAEQKRMSAAGVEGLRMIVKHDQTGREIREFVNAGTRKAWMDPYRAPGFEMLRINNKVDLKDNARFEKNWHEMRKAGLI